MLYITPQSSICLEDPENILTKPDSLIFLAMLRHMPVIRNLGAIWEGQVVRHGLVIAYLWNVRYDSRDVR